MNNLDQESVENVIENGIKHPIRILTDSDALAGAIQLVYSGIDAMAFLSITDNRDEVTRSDFVHWVERYIKFRSTDQPAPIDVYGARCAILHCFGSESELSRRGKCRVLVYARDVKPEVLAFDDVVLVSVRGLVSAFFRGIDEFLKDIALDSALVARFNMRLIRLNHRHRAEDVRKRIDAV